MQEAKVVAMGEQPPNEEKLSLQEQAKKMIEPLIDELEKYDISDHKMKSVIDFSVNLFAKYHRHMTVPRMLRKIVDEFKLRPLPQTKSDGSNQTAGA